MAQNSPAITRKPPIFVVPTTAAAVLNFSQKSDTPESTAKHHLLSSSPRSNAIALVGMGGSGKTTTLISLARLPEIHKKFPDAIYFIQLGQHVSIASFLDQLHDLVQRTVPIWLHRFQQLAAKHSLHVQLVNELVDHLQQMRFLLIFDDVWEITEDVFLLVTEICARVRQMNSTSFKVLTSTRAWNIGRRPIHDKAIDVNPQQGINDMARRILFHYADVGVQSSHAHTHITKQAIDDIIQKCAGLPLALSVAGKSVLRIMERQRSGFRDNAWVQYRDSLKRNMSQLVEAPSWRHDGLFVSLRSSLQILRSKWLVTGIDVYAVLRSFSVLRKQMWMPLYALQRMWQVQLGDAEQVLEVLSENNICSLVMDEGSAVVGVRVHDLVHEFCKHMAEKEEGEAYWHRKLVNGYCACRELSLCSDGGVSERPWWKIGSLDGGGRYMEDNIIRHLLHGGRPNDALRLLTDYRWVQCVNSDEQRMAFQKVISDLQMLKEYMKTNVGGGLGRQTTRDLDVLIETMQQGMVPYCMDTREQCTFQLYGRLTSLKRRSELLQRVLWSIERYAKRPWVRAKAGVLSSVEGNLKRVLPTGRSISVMNLEEDRLAVGNYGGEVKIVNREDGSQLDKLVGQDETVGVCIDQKSNVVYSCCHGGVISAWKKGDVLWTVQVCNDEQEGTSAQVNLDEEREYLVSMELLQTRGVLVCGSSNGLLRIFDKDKCRLLKSFKAHESVISSLTAAISGKIFVSSSWDQTVRVWDGNSFEQIGDPLKGHTSDVACVALTRDDSMLASGSFDKCICLWDVDKRDLLCQPLTAQRERVLSVVFNSDGTLLYSAGYRKICVWDVRCPQNGVSLTHTFVDKRMNWVTSLCISADDCELFANSKNGEDVFVWRAQVKEQEAEQVGERQYLRDVEKFGISDDGETIVILNKNAEWAELRSVSDVSNGIDQVITRLHVPAQDNPIRRIAVSNNQRLIAYTYWNDPQCVVHIADVENEAKCSLTALSDWIQDLNESCGTSLIDSCVQSISFKSDSSSLTAYARAQTKPSLDWIRKSVCWNVTSIKDLSSTNVSLQVAESAALDNPRPIKRPRLLCQRNSADVYQATVWLDNGKNILPLATLEDNPQTACYVANTHRLWISRLDKNSDNFDNNGIEYVDLISEDSILGQGEAPRLPVLPQIAEEDIDANKNTTEDIQETYTVFISHAGPDKATLAELICAQLTALGISVFLDKLGLRPGHHAPRKMLHAMRTAKIAIVILSAEFAARKWTLMELSCFLERFEKSERDVIIIPVFYRLSLADCRSAEALFKMVDENGEKVFMKEGFLERLAEEGGSIQDVFRSLQKLRSITGIENVEGATNGTGREEEDKRTRLGVRIVAAVQEALARITQWMGRGPSV